MRYVTIHEFGHGYFMGLLASNGTPLRAKISVSLKEQDAKYELLQSVPGSNTFADKVS